MAGKRKKTAEVAILLSVVVLALVLSALAFYSLYADYHNSRNINPALLQAFSAIMVNCSYTNDYHERVTCDAIKEAHRRLGGRPTRRNAAKWRVYLMDQGFPLPPLYRPGYTPW